MRRLVPDVADEDLDDLYTGLEFPPPPPQRPWLYLDMVASVDGAATVAGRTRELGGEADRIAFSRLREWCDLVLVGASTVRIEDYGPARPTSEARARRTSRGLAPAPRLAVVTASAALNPGARLFGESEAPVVVLAPEDADAARLEALDAVAEVRRVGHGRVDLAAALGGLREAGVDRVLCEGGPSLNSELLAAGLVDEIFLTVSPQLVGGGEPHRIVGPLDGPPRTLRLVELREHDGELLLRYRITPS